MLNLGRIVVVGAGLAGLRAARVLRDAGHEAVTVIDKARGVGGRLSTRRHGELRVDIGAQFFTVKDPAFAAWVEPLLKKGVAREWSRSFPLWDAGAITPRASGHPRYACPEGMTALAKELSEGLTLRLGQAVTRIQQASPGYHLGLADGSSLEADTLLLNLPPAQLLSIAAPLLEPSWSLPISRVEMAPCWAVYGRLSADFPASITDWNGLEWNHHPVLQWVARDHTRRGRTQPPVLVAHTTESFARAHIESAPEDIAREVADALEQTLGVHFDEAPQAHRWRYSVPKGEPTGLLWSMNRRLGICGDWCEGGRVEGAWLSGERLAASILGESR